VIKLAQRIFKDLKSKEKKLMIWVLGILASLLVGILLLDLCIGAIGWFRY
jgi:hypothetical protein